MDPGNGRESAYTSRLCKALRCITAASSSALLTHLPNLPLPGPNALFILLHTPFRLGPLCLLICASATTAMSFGTSAPCTTIGSAHAPVGRAGECAVNEQCCILSDALRRCGRQRSQPKPTRCLVCRRMGMQPLM
ncbi:hypothetical protein BD309DRAFT_79589 [Dichomitus squalens]|uniref:Uncharacterized protein n=1 Tax=Dichomitus squalens TaxID=114155 RepID=A0A4Q9NQJ2_9APHY|nr:hypothetical protein BD309DRAFT_79589 [Dichomitus squalens]TBU61771.1 hypothetical protein BD310DRAFT_145167 [Dichomitus squalens]